MVVWNFLAGWLCLLSSRRMEHCGINHILRCAQCEFPVNWHVDRESAPTTCLICDGRMVWPSN